MDFTREPIIETVITPKEGCKLVVRSSKSNGQEEYFVDSLEVVSFGNTLFFRSLERPKSFVVPASDYEILEVREARMVLKNVGIERSIKIGGGKAAKEAPQERPEPVASPEPTAAASEGAEASSENKPDARLEKRRDKRRHSRRRRGREDGDTEEGESTVEGVSKEENGKESEPKDSQAAEKPVNYISNLLPPPTTLISETIARYRDNAIYKSAFYVKDEVESKEGEPAMAAEGNNGILPAAAEGETHQNHAEDLLEAISMRNAFLEQSEFGVFSPIEDEGLIPPPPTEPVEGLIQPREEEPK